MALSPYIQSLRAHVGTARLLLPSVSAHVFDDQGRLLLVQQRDNGVWSTPGGFIEPDERPADAARREAWEETGLTVRVEGLAGVYGGPECVVRYPNGDETQYVIIAFRCAVEAGELQPDHDETVAVRFCSAVEAASLPLAPWLRPLLPGVFTQHAGPHYQAPSWEPPALPRSSFEELNSRRDR